MIIFKLLHQNLIRNERTKDPSHKSHSISERQAQWCRQARWTAAVSDLQAGRRSRQCVRQAEVCRSGHVCVPCSYTSRTYTATPDNKPDISTSFRSGSRNSAWRTAMVSALGSGAKPPEAEKHSLFECPKEGEFGPLLRISR